MNENVARLLKEADKLHERFLLSEKVGPDYFEPGMMEYLDKSEGLYDPATGELLLRFESRGTRYEGRSDRIERVRIGDAVRVVGDPGNAFNKNNFLLFTDRGGDVGNMPAELCNAVAPLYDEGDLEFREAKVSYVEPLSSRSRHAKQAVLFVELRCVLDRYVTGNRS